MHIVIVEDEPAIAERIERLTREILESKVDRIRHFPDVDSAIEHISENATDLLMLDLKLTGRSGFDVLRDTAAQSYQTIIISAYSDQAITAFEWGVLDFVNKPFARARLESALLRFVDTENRANIAARYLSVKKGRELEVIDIEDLVYVAGMDNYSELVLTDGRKRLHDKSLAKLQMVLPPVFFRIHKSYIVRMNRVKKMHTHRGGRYELELEDGTVLPVGRTRYKEVQELFI